MPEQMLPHKSVRFFPHWRDDDIYQVIGLLNMVNYILDTDPMASHWIEIGSLYGESSTIFLGFDKIKKLECIDKIKEFTNKLEKKFSRYVTSKRCIIHNKESKECASVFSDHSIDVIYIDGDHSYDYVKQDIHLYFPKIKIGGFICGHDYSKAWPSVISAVNEFADSISKEIIVFSDSSWLIRK